MTMLLPLCAGVYIVFRLLAVTVRGARSPSNAPPPVMCTPSALFSLIGGFTAEQEQALTVLHNDGHAVT